MIQKIKGTFDILPSQIPQWRFIEETARKISANYGFSEIRTPTFEATELFKRGVGDTSDVVQKEMYTFLDRGDEGRSITLRPEGTASVVRAIIENGKCSDTMPLKLFYLINCFRCEAPQAGRSREFVQFGTELFGTDNGVADAEIISLALRVIKELGITSTSLHINSIGCPDCRPAYREKLVEYFKDNHNDLCDTCKGRLDTNPMRILDCKSPICQGIAKDAPKSIDHLCDNCKTHQNDLETALKALGIDYVIDPKIVRGLDYYTKTVFEIISNKIGAQSTICGGGRYDGLTELLDGPKLPGIGFGMGITRLILAMDAEGIEVAKPDGPKVYIATLGKAAMFEAIKIVSALRDNSVYAETDIVQRSLKAQMKYANKIGAKYTIIIGDTEIEQGKAILRNMSDSSQVEVEISKLLESVL